MASDNPLIAELESNRDVAGLIAELRDVDSSARWLAAKALGRIGHVRAVEQLVAALRDSERLVRCGVAGALGRIGDKRATEPLIAALRDSDWMVRPAAAEALGRIGDERATEPLIAALRDADRMVRAGIAEALVRIAQGQIKSITLGLPEPRGVCGEPAPMPETLSYEPAPVASTRVGLTAFHPKELRPGIWYTLLAYLHLWEALAAVQADSRKHLEPRIPTGTSSRDTQRKIARGVEIAVVPELPGCRVNPGNVRFSWLEDWHCTDFRLQAAADVAGFAPDTTVKGRIAFYAESLLVGEVPIWTHICEEGAEQSEAPVGAASAALYQAIFASYAHQDSDVVESLARASKALGNDFLRDVETLRSGEKWYDRLLDLIERADVFQLYWSEAAKRSAYVEKEWRHALEQARTAFIRPVYWRQPMPEPPHELAHIHFAFCPLRRRSWWRRWIR